MYLIQTLDPSTGEWETQTRRKNLVDAMTTADRFPGSRVWRATPKPPVAYFYVRAFNPLTQTWDTVAIAPSRIAAKKIARETPGRTTVTRIARRKPKTKKRKVAPIFHEPYVPLYKRTK